MEVGDANQSKSNDIKEIDKFKTTNKLGLIEKGLDILSEIDSNFEIFLIVMEKLKIILHPY